MGADEARESTSKFEETGSDCSDMREEGPILLTINEVTGPEILPELRDRLKELENLESNFTFSKWKYLNFLTSN